MNERDLRASSRRRQEVFSPNSTSGAPPEAEACPWGDSESRPSRIRL